MYYHDDKSCCCPDPDSHYDRDYVVVSKSAEELHAQEVLNQHLYQAIHILQQIDFHSEELALIRDMFLLACDPRFHSICLTPYKVQIPL